MPLRNYNALNHALIVTLVKEILNITQTENLSVLEQNFKTVT